MPVRALLIEASSLDDPERRSLVLDPVLYRLLTRNRVENITPTARLTEHRELPPNAGSKAPEATGTNGARTVQDPA